MAADRHHERRRQCLMPQVHNDFWLITAIHRRLHVMVRYIVDSVDAAVDFYSRHFGFRLANKSGPNFALLERANLQLVLSPPKGPGGGSQRTPDGRRPEPGGWNRIIVQTNSLESDVRTLESAGVKFRSDVVAGPGGRQILAEDPSGNLVELFEPAPSAN
jgi:catechol 2,3-dioxygenase-like lactoylglutathione lyase family enzyme